ncbi:MAG: GLUG motif-containing protein [Planctomycetota bacterium]|jgi:hypothetical protein
MNMLRTTLIVFGLFVLVSPTQAKYSGGSGTAEDPYRISTAADMNAIGTDSNDYDKYFVVTNDIDMSSIPGTAYNRIYPFTGVFDGNGHTISNFSYTPTSGGAGLFGRVDGGVNSGIIKDLGLIDPNVDGGTFWSNIGALVGNLRYGAIVTNCYVRGGSVNGELNIGGLVGKIYPTGGTISNCYATANVSGMTTVGGLLGKIEAGTVTNCYATGAVTAAGHDYVSDYAGGLVGGSMGGMVENSYATGNVTEEGDGLSGSSGGLLGYNDDSYGVSIVNNCYATGNVSGTTDVGGLVGNNSSGTSVINCYSTGSVSGTSEVGGLIGDNSGTVTNSFWDKETSGKTTSAGGTGKTTAEMKKQSTFTNWDFVEIWNIGEKQTYPFLRVYPAGDLNHDGRVDLLDFAIVANNWQIGVE